MKEEQTFPAELRDEWQVFIAKRPGKPRRKQLKGWAYCHASIVADIFCDATARPDAHGEARELIGRGFKTLGALVGVPAPPFSFSSHAWKKVREAYLEMQRVVRSLCQAEGLKDVPHDSDLGELDKYTRAGEVARVAVYLSTVLHRF
jgi:hypothetical protein